MAFTKINAAGIGSTETVTLDGLTVINDGSFGGNVSVGGTLTYEDVTNIDSVGLITARAGVVVGSGITLSKDGDIFATGVTTATSFVGDGSQLTGVASTENIRTNTNATFLQNINVSGSTTTGSLVSSGAISGTTGTFTGDVDIADKIVHTGDTDTAIRFSGADTVSVETAGSERLQVTSAGTLKFTGQGTGLDTAAITHHTNNNLYIRGGTAGLIVSNHDSTNTIQISDSNFIKFETSNGSERLRLNADGNALLRGGSVSYLVLGSSGDSGFDASISNNMNWIRGNGDNLQLNCANGGFMSFETNGTERLRIYGNGAVLIGSNAGEAGGDARLAIDCQGMDIYDGVGDASNYGLIFANDSNNNKANGIGFFNDSASTCGGYIVHQDKGSGNIGDLVFATSASSDTPVERLRIESGGNALFTTNQVKLYNNFDTSNTYLYTENTGGGNAGIKMKNQDGEWTIIANDRLRFIDDDASIERLSITSSGQVYINTTATDTMFGIKNTGTFEFITCRDTSNTLKFYIHHSGNAYNTNNSWNQISDQSLKENIVDAKSQWNDIKNIKIRNFNFTEASGYDTHTQIGCVAQEVETVSPKLVSTPRADGIKTVSTSVLYMKGMKALQEAMTRIETLEAKVAALEG